MGETRIYVGGQRLSNEGEKLQYTDLNRLAQLAERSALHVLAEIFRVHNDGAPRSGVFGDSFEVTATGGLAISVGVGLGFYYNSAETSDWWSHWRPLANSAAAPRVHAARDALLDRIDVVSAAPDTADDNTVADQIRNPATGVINTQNIDTRRRWSSTITVTTGVPGAIPVPPALPAGHIYLADVLVPSAAAGTPIEITDRRTKLKITMDKLSSQGLRSAPTVNAEAADVITIDVQLTTLDGAAYAGVVDLWVEVFDAAFASNPAANTVWESGAGTEIMGGGAGVGTVRMLVSTDDAGQAQISVHDVAGASGAYAYVKVTPANQATEWGVPWISRVLFD